MKLILRKYENGVLILNHCVQFYVHPSHEQTVDNYRLCAETIGGRMIIISKHIYKKHADDELNLIYKELSEVNS